MKLNILTDINTADPPYFILGPEVPSDKQDSFISQLLRDGLPMSPYEAGKYLSSYFKHDIGEDGNLIRLAYEPDPGIPSTVSRMNPEEVASCLPAESPKS